MFSSIILAAGKGQRMKSKVPKVLHKIGQYPLLWYPLTILKNLKCKEIAVVINKEMKEVSNYINKEFDEANIIVQNKQLGTADAVNSTKKLSEKFKENLLILYGDVPLLKKETIKKFTKVIDNKVEIKILVFKTKSSNEYGRIVLDKQKKLKKIVEFKDTTPSEKKINLCNSGIIFGKTKTIFNLIELVKNNNNSGEYYLTDIVKIANEKKIKVAYEICNKKETKGINTRKDLAEAEKILQNQKRKFFLKNGVTLSDPKSNYFSYDTEIGKDTIIGQNVVIGKNVKIGENCNILPFTHLEDCEISSESSIGPFSRLRSGTIIKNNCKIGNFVEIKNSTLYNKNKVNHLSYVGDAFLNENVNVGAGTIFCNFNGFEKNQISIGENSFVGSNSSLIAPLEIGKETVIGSGSVITKDVPSGDLALARIDQKNLKKSGKKYLNRKK